ncbi:hypothetical protein E2320_000689 [Naja naja]|nr:hypothetical protein E2320_000689 [Naja naja]
MSFLQETKLVTTPSLFFSILAGAQEVQAENVTVAEGGQAEINCKLHQYDGSIVVIQNPSRQTLFFNGTRALKDERFQLVEFTQKQVRIVLSNARLEDEVPPDSPLVEVKEQAVEGGEVELTCSVPRSRPAATLRWYRDRKEIKGVIPNAELGPCGNHMTDKINVFPGNKQENGKVFSITSMVRFRVDRKDHSSIVTCEAIHPALRGQRKQTQYVLDVQYSPTARIHPPQGVMREGDTLILTCAVNGNPLILVF